MAPENAKLRLKHAIPACAALALLGAAPASGPSPDDRPVGPPPMQGEVMAYLGLGAITSCARFLAIAQAEHQARPPDADENVAYTAVFGALISWSEGYITARNEEDRLNRTAGANSNRAQRARWLELFCQANPDATFMAAVYRLREHLVADGL